MGEKLILDFKGLARIELLVSTLEQQREIKFGAFLVTSWWRGAANAFAMGILVKEGGTTTLLGETGAMRSIIL